MYQRNLRVAPLHGHSKLFVLTEEKKIKKMTTLYGLQIKGWRGVKYIYRTSSTETKKVVAVFPTEELALYEKRTRFTEYPFYRIIKVQNDGYLGKVPLYNAPRDYRGKTSSPLQLLQLLVTHFPVDTLD